MKHAFPAQISYIHRNRHKSFGQRELGSRSKWEMSAYFNASKIPNCSLWENGGVEDWKWMCSPSSVIYKLRYYIKMAVIHYGFI